MPGSLLSSNLARHAVKHELCVSRIEVSGTRERASGEESESVVIEVDTQLEVVPRTEAATPDARHRGLAAANLNARRVSYRCRHCDYTSEFPNNVIRHEHSHDDLKPYRCTQPECRFVMGRQKGRPCEGNGGVSLTQGCTHLEIDEIAG